MDKRFAIFDMDGTLVDSMVFWQRLGREYLASRGLTEGVEPVLERVKAMTMSESAALFVEELGVPGTPEAVEAEMNGIMEIHYRRDIPLKPGAAAYLDGLRRRGARLCVASATAEPLMAACLERLEVADRFEFLLSCETVGAGKSRPDVYLACARRFGAEPGEIAVFEDAVYAARTAKDAGFYTAAVYDPAGAKSWEKLTALADEAVLDWADAAQTL
ncbi:HAD family phosphatase [uncultured Dysosmobacter sp.]|uniref:HAD family hydrolase n=1 Tax=uncultured Dysosmobacter sp. TaxID=2591384 RepID=UPI00262C6987|nr:HAD family phosphatase [uncultured Dysosmobacter sp.]